MRGTIQKDSTVFCLRQAHIPDFLASVLYVGSLAAIISAANFMLLADAGESSGTLYHRMISPKLQHFS